MKTKVKRIFLGLMAVLMVGATGCSPHHINSPQDAIIDAYGDRLFRISFDSTNLVNPIADMYYSAKNMPVLPTPSKVGYVFQGWYFDNNYIDQCNIDEGDLLWKMTNVTLYAKWEMEQIVNNGQYDIEFEAHIVEDSISMGPLAHKYGYYRFDEDIVKYGTYIEKNDNGTYLRIQYDLRTRGPVLGGEDSDEESNFSKQTYTVTDSKNRISEELSIFDRTSTLQTIYYDISGLNLSDPITLFVEYYNWVDDIPEKNRRSASVTYDVEFNITRFIGFGAPFVNASTRIEDGIYSLPTHYAGLDKSPSILDMFNPVTSYIVASKGTYRLYKPMSAYNNDFSNMKEEYYPFRTTGFAKEFTGMLVDQNITVSKEQENPESDNFIPRLFKAKEFVDIVCEFNAENGQYYYCIDLGKTLDKDIVFYGGSSGAMEQMFSFGFSYRRLCIDYKSMVRVADWTYKAPAGDRFLYKKTVTMYPGYNTDFDKSNVDFEQFKKYKSSIDYPTCFYTLRKDNTVKVYSSRITVSPKYKGDYISNMRNSFQYFDMSFEIFGYNPKTDGKLYSRDLTFNAADLLAFSNSTINENVVGKSVNVGDAISLTDILNEKIANGNTLFTYKAYEVDDNLNVDFEKPVDLDMKFTFEKNVAVLYDLDYKTHHGSCLVILAKKENPKVIMVDDNWNLGVDNTYISTRRFNIGDEVNVPKLQYNYYGKRYFLNDLKKYDEDDGLGTTDYTRVSYWGLDQGIYTNHDYNPFGNGSDFVMDQEKVVAMMQLENQFGEFVNYYCLFKGVSAGEFDVKDESGTIIINGDLKYDNNKRHPINHEYLNVKDIYDQNSIEVINQKLVLDIDDEGKHTSFDIPLSFILIYTKTELIKVYGLDQVWEKIKLEPYAIIYFYYQNDYGDQVLYKGQYNFRVEGEGLEKFTIVNEEKAFFTNKKVRVQCPLLTNIDNRNLTNGTFNIMKKVSNHYIDNIYDAVRQSHYNSYIELEFRESGEYLITYTFSMTTNFNGDALFDYIDPEDRFSTVEISISQLITVYDRNADVSVTFVTDNQHPFDPTSEELFGYTITKDGKHQYATKKFKAEDKIRSLSQFAMKGPGRLYRWADKNNKKVARPNVFMPGLHANMESLNVFLYAGWDLGSVVHVQYDIYGEITHCNDVQMIKNEWNVTDKYSMDASLFMFPVPPKYVVAGWRADQNVFFEEIEVNGEEKHIKTNYHKGQIVGFMEFDGETTLTCILKLPARVSYEAYDVNGNKVEFLEPMASDYNMFIGDKFIESVPRTKLDLLYHPRCSDLDLKFKYWTVYDQESESYLVCDIDSLMLLTKYQDGAFIKLRAIFG